MAELVRKQQIQVDNTLKQQILAMLDGFVDGFDMCAVCRMLGLGSLTKKVNDLVFVFLQLMWPIS